MPGVKKNARQFASIAVSGITLLVDYNDPSFSYSYAIADTNGMMTISADIANDPLFVGAYLYVQLVMFDGSNPGGVSASNAVKVTVRP